MTDLTQKNDGYTVAAIGLMAMCLVTFDHEALGHGGMCLALGGHIRILTSAIFRCDLQAIWIDPAGPFGNFLVGGLSLFLVDIVPRRAAGARLFLILVTSFSFFWEAGYLIDAMRGREGDLYFAAQEFLGEPSQWWRITGALAGLCVYLFTSRWASRSLFALWPSVTVARGVSRTAWVIASLGAALAATAYSGGGFSDLRDAVLEIGAASLPLLVIPLWNQQRQPPPTPVHIRRSRITIGASLGVYLIFVATFGRGLRF